MIGLIWNCRGVSKKGMSTFIKELLYDYHVDFVGLQETIKKNYSDKFFRQIDPGKAFSWHWLPATGRSGGMLCGVKKDRFEVLKFEQGQFSVVANVLDKKLKKNLVLATVYGPAHDDTKEEFLTELSQLCTNRKFPMIIGGDFNILRFSSEKNKIFSRNRFTEMFNYIINSFEMRDLTLNGGNFTWSNNQWDPTLERLDRVLMSEDWEQIFPLTNLRKIPRLMSDHNPLLLCSDQEKVQTSRPFCFETSWIKHQEFIPKITEIWTKNVKVDKATEIWSIKLKRVKKNPERLGTESERTQQEIQKNPARGVA